MPLTPEPSCSIRPREFCPPGMYIDWQERLSCCFSDPAHRRRKYYVEAYMLLLLGEFFEIREGACLVLFPIVLSTVTCLQ